jgi:hypothetical protein
MLWSIRRLWACRAQRPTVNVADAIGPIRWPPLALRAPADGVGSIYPVQQGRTQIDEFVDGYCRIAGPVERHFRQAVLRAWPYFRRMKSKGVQTDGRAQWRRRRRLPPLLRRARRAVGSSLVGLSCSSPRSPVSGLSGGYRQVRERSVMAVTALRSQTPEVPLS